ncbi:hypothetical protein JK361_23495 [Streptomyces sp. 5-8]|uniref:Integral membrane protein n=1 Tax=Streptomyces musisoli TaxID=2802280 RepID=A0ABS1P578_9ACTN|nr:MULTISPECIES: hypothetical protein [Streptomyces]MBL1107526.1 hypothetical protein [Streptomyces musisoli]MBY8842807.1 hypothetical protein [Streptomyces sp. SP2-10]
MSTQADRRWAQLARELEFTQLPELRRQAEGWRNGLAGLTALLTVLVTLKGRDDLAQLPHVARLAASAALGTAFLLFVTGSVLAVRAAHGHPGDRVLLAGQSLRRWTEQEIVRVGRALRYASLCSGTGLVLVAGAVVLAWATTEPPPDHLVRVTTTTGERCGQFVGAGRDGIVLKTERDGGRDRLLLPTRTVLAVTPVGTCGAAR